MQETPRSRTVTRRSCVLFSIPMSPPETSTPTVLLVEDFEDARVACAIYLRQQGFNVLEAADGQEAIDMATRLLPSVVLMDLSLPIVDGWEATRRLKAQESTRHIPVIALTAHTQDWHRRAALEAGCDGYLTKPFDADTLLSGLRRAVRLQDVAT
jgi:two-component system cell cycle response regulator DivK